MVVGVLLGSAVLSLYTPFTNYLLVLTVILFTVMTPIWPSALNTLLTPLSALSKLLAIRAQRKATALPPALEALRSPYALFSGGEPREEAAGRGNAVKTSVLTHC